MANPFYPMHCCRNTKFIASATANIDNYIDCPHDDYIYEIAEHVHKFRHFIKFEISKAQMRAREKRGGYKKRRKVIKCQ